MTKKICHAFEGSAGGGRFETVMELMTRMQALGNPPKDLVGKGGQSSMPEGVPEQCKMS